MVAKDILFMRVNHWKLCRKFLCPLALLGMMTLLGDFHHGGKQSWTKVVDVAVGQKKQRRLKQVRK